MREKCRYCRCPTEGTSVRYRNTRGKEFLFCGEPCAQMYQISKNVSLKKVGGFWDKLNDGLDRTNNFLQGINSLLNG